MLITARPCIIYKLIMIYGTGIDLIKIERMKEVVDKWGVRFLTRVFTENEIRYCYEKKDPSLSLAVRFAAKEAVIKAIDARAVIPLADIEVLNLDNGRPVINARGSLKEFLSDRSIKNIHLSLSHEREYGIASVIMEG